jgi:hypothetical protein
VDFREVEGGSVDFFFIKLKEKNIMLRTLLGLWTKPALLMASSSKPADGFCGW